jgi:protoporphyrinogen oxidase
MILVYLVLEQYQFSPYDAHYFPETRFPIARLSEPKNYANTREPNNRTVICAELPCSPQDDFWNYDDQMLEKLVSDSLQQAGLPIQAQIIEVMSRRIRYAYPVYQVGYENAFQSLDSWLGRQQELLTFGRQGLFAHDNAHHALLMGYSAAECLHADGIFDRHLWNQYRSSFNLHVVED